MKDITLILIWTLAVITAVILVTTVTFSINQRTKYGIDYPGETKSAHGSTGNPQQTVNGKELQ